MLFSSALFIWIFLPIVLLLNAILSLIKFSDESQKFLCKNILLLVASLIFYAWGGLYYVILMLSVIIINYLGGILIKTLSNHSKMVLAITVILNLSILFYFKYFNLAINVFERIFMGGAGALGLKEVVLPIGISFYIFQAMSYVVDVYCKRTDAQRNFLMFALYVSLFPQLIAGPIVKYHEVEEQLFHREESFEKFSYGVKRFCYGLGKKVIISNTLAAAVDSIFALEISEIGMSLAWFGMISYSLQIYYDFSGYSDMAIGLGKMLGFDFRENFNYPYTSLSITEFWRRWHISLSSWFRDYVYIPLGGNRGTLFKTCLNLFVVFLLTGIWHGANFTFFAWGLYYAVIIVIEKLLLGKLLKNNKIKLLNWIYMIVIVMIGWVMFRASHFTYGLGFIASLFHKKAGADSIFSFLSMRYIIVFVAAIVFSGFLQRLLKGVYDRFKNRFLFMLADYLIQIVALAYSIILIVSGTYNPFIYFQF